MKVLVNKDWGGFDFPNEVVDMLIANYAWAQELDPDYLEDDIESDYRDNPDVIAEFEKWFAENPRKSDIRVVELPEETTDWRINENDGFEIVWYVVNGKLHTK